MKHYSATLSFTMNDDSHTMKSIDADVAADSAEDAEKLFGDFMNSLTNGDVRHFSVRNVSPVDEPMLFSDCVTRAIDDLYEHIDNLDEDEKYEFFTKGEEYDVISDIADAHTPTMNGAIFEVVSSDTRCWDNVDAKTEDIYLPDVAKMYIYYAIKQELYDEFNRIKDDRYE